MPVTTVKESSRQRALNLKGPPHLSGLCAEIETGNGHLGEREKVWSSLGMVKKAAEAAAEGGAQAAQQPRMSLSGS